MVKKLILTTALVACIFLTVDGQNKTSNQTYSVARIRDNTLGVSFAKIGRVVKSDNTTYSIKLTSDTSPAQAAIANVSVSGRLFIDLPGSYGGRVYLDSPAGAKLLHYRVRVDSVHIDGRYFRREYWAVYAGMGQWDCVINCYSKENGKYYIVSLIQGKPVGKPGEIVGSNKITTDALQLKALSSMQDTTENIVGNFNKLLSSIEIQIKK